MLYVLKDKCFEEGYYEHTMIVCGFISAAKAKNIEYVLKEYLIKYDNVIISPNDYFNILKENSETIIAQFSKILGSNIEGKKLFDMLRIDGCYEWPRDWKDYGPWFKSSEIAEF